MDSTPENEPGFDLGVQEPAQSASNGASYRVLARKYRPQSFEDLIGQEAMVRTLSNAFDTGRIAQAYVFTGVRGVGKTTTARILARALNYELPGEVDKPSIHLARPGIHCQAIMEGRHVDVMEIDAASHTGIDDVRAITDGARYAPVSARYKVYIVDEVHMLSEKAWNAFLKTLEEPPAHVKFMFATTEIRKVPVTVLSRCQRFDLRRVDADVLVRHLQTICEKEKVEVEADALGLIARAGEGSVRDSLSILDQAIAHSIGGTGAGKVGADEVRRMLGLADRARVIDLFQHLMAGDIAAAMAELKSQYDDGADPEIVLTELAEFVHFVTRVKVVREAADDLSFSETERNRGRDFAAKLSHRVLTRAWQMLMKGIEEVARSPKPFASADMVLVRIAYAADLPTPDEALRMLADGGAAAAARPAGNGNGDGRWLPRPGCSRLPCRTAHRSPCRRRRPAARPSPASSSAPSRRSSPMPARSATSASRRRSNATCIWCAARTAASTFASPAWPRRPLPATCRRSSPTGPASAGWSPSPRRRASRPSASSRRRRRPTASAACARTRPSRR
ncbi:DNA polymerase III subunit tau [bacterium YEK0313]|nr:DNA polymerase III subunit tau [bacterium YEK0313]